VSSSSISNERSSELTPWLRILDAAARQIASVGAAELSMSGVAREAGVSKALIHYHFRDKSHLLASVVSLMADGLVRREHECLVPYESDHNPLAVDAVWNWLASELQRGHIRVLLELDSYRGEEVRSAAIEAARRRRLSARATVERLFRILDLTPRVESALLGNVVVAFVDGLALDVGLLAESGDSSAIPSSARVAFDVFWLAMLSLAE
jgi:AcrR family transcriptional regulator